MTFQIVKLVWVVGLAGKPPKDTIKSGRPQKKSVESLFFLIYKH